MAKPGAKEIYGSELKHSVGSSYILREGTVTSADYKSGYVLPYKQSPNDVTKIIITTSSNNLIYQDGGLIIRSGPQPSSVSTVGNVTTLTYSGQPNGQNFSHWEISFNMYGKAGAYTSESVTVTTNVNGVSVSSTLAVRLASANANTQPPDGYITNISVSPSAKSADVEFDTPDRTEYTLFGSQKIYGSGRVAGRLESLTQNTSYNLAVYAVNIAGSYPAIAIPTVAGTPIVTFKTLPLPLAPVAPLINSITPAFSSVLVQFTSSPERAAGNGKSFPNSYRVYYRLTSDPDVIGSYVYADYDNTKTTVEVTGLLPNTSYTFYMTARNEGGSSVASAQVLASTLANDGLPPAPTGFTATATGPTTAQLAWSQSIPSNILGTAVYVSTNGVDYAPFQADNLQPTATSFTATGLEPNTLYYFSVFTYNLYQGTLHVSTAPIATVTTNVAPANPDTPTLLSAVSINNNTVVLNWAAGANATQTGFKIYRGVTTGDYVEIANTDANTTSYQDTGLDSNATYYYAIKATGYVADSAYSNELSVTTQYNQGEISYTCPFTLHPDSTNQTKEVGGRAIITSDLDRWLVRYKGQWNKAGLRPVRGETTIAATSGGVLEVGDVYRVYIVLARGETRSIPSPASNEITIAGSNKTIVITPPLNEDEDGIECRDYGYDLFGNTIAGADAWEIYIAEQNQGKAYLVERLELPCGEWETSLGSKTYTIDPTLTKQQLFDNTRRPMELLGESSLPPSCPIIESLTNRVACTGEVDLQPTQAEIDGGASLSVAGGSKEFTVSDWDATDACVYHRLYINNIDTGWEVYDYDYDETLVSKVTKCYIRHSDPAVQEAGFGGAGGEFTNFALKGNPDRVYFSAYFSGGALEQLAYSPETFPPLTIYESEFSPDDNTSPTALVAAGGSLLVAKPSKWITATGGDEPDVPFIQTTVISRGSGLNAPKSIARDSNDVVYYLGDTGPFRVTPSGVDKVNIRFGNARLFTEVFDISSVPTARGSWFSREEWYVVVGLNRKGSSGNRDGFILDVKNSALMPFTTYGEIAHIAEYKNDGGEFQLFQGLDGGRSGYLFKTGIYVDNIDYTQAFPTQSAVGIDQYGTTGIVDTEHAMVPRWIQPRIKTYPAGAEFQVQFDVDKKLRCDDPTSFNPTGTVTFTTPITSDHVSLASQRCDQMQLRWSSSTLADSPQAYYELKELPLRVVLRNAS